MLRRVKQNTVLQDQAPRTSDLVHNILQKINQQPLVLVYQKIHKEKKLDLVLLKDLNQADQ
jgi:hypothetical protein